MGNNKTPQLFVWRGFFILIEKFNIHLTVDKKIRSKYDITIDRAERKLRRDMQLFCSASPGCPFCESELIASESGDYSSGNLYNRDSICHKCGYTRSYLKGHGLTEEWETDKISLLKRLSINDAELGYKELGAHMKRKYTDRFNLAPRRFEELVTDVYKQLGYQVRLTQQSHDGEYDILLLDSGSNEQIIIERKRYAKRRSVGVGVVREVLGVQLLDNFSKAKIVTTSKFSLQAKKDTRRINTVLDGFHLGLVDAGVFLKELDVYNANLPPLHLLDLKNYPGKD